MHIVKYYSKLKNLYYITFCGWLNNRLPNICPMNVTLIWKKSLYRCNLVKNLEMRSSSINWMRLKFKETYPRRMKKRPRDTQERKHCEDQGWDWNHASINQELQLPQRLGEAGNTEPLQGSISANAMVPRVPDMWKNKFLFF